VVLVIRADEARHRDVNHGFADELDGCAADAPASPNPAHADDLRLAA
jgi:ubiquinol oxidase